MKKAFAVLEPGFLTTLQDKGRYNYKRMGVPQSGVMDSFAYKVGLHLLNNPSNSGVLEFTFPAPKLQVLTDMIICLTGSNFQPLVNQVAVPMWEVFQIHKGDILEFTRNGQGRWCYLHVKGGFFTPLIMGSCSTYLRAEMGGIEGRRLISGDVLQIRNTTMSAKVSIGSQLTLDQIPDYSSPTVVRVITGPQWDKFTARGKATFLNREYTVSQLSDRVGYRLEGQKLEFNGNADIISEGLTPGAIQVFGNGAPVVMLADGQTVGGYQKIGWVIKEDLSRFAQLRVGDVVQFQHIGIEQAHELISKEQEIETIKGDLSRYKVQVSDKVYNVIVEEI